MAIRRPSRRSPSDERAGAPLRESPSRRHRRWLTAAEVYSWLAVVR